MRLVVSEAVRRFASVMTAASMSQQHKAGLLEHDIKPAMHLVTCLSITRLAAPLKHHQSAYWSVFPDSGAGDHRNIIQHCGHWQFTQRRDASPLLLKASNGRRLANNSGSIARMLTGNYRKEMLYGCCS